MQREQREHEPPGYVRQDPGTPHRATNRHVSAWAVVQDLPYGFSGKVFRRHGVREGCTSTGGEAEPGRDVLVGAFVERFLGSGRNAWMSLVGVHIRAEQARDEEHDVDPKRTEFHVESVGEGVEG
jgi:hypothetical protein